MKVLCIKQGKWEPGDNSGLANGPSYGEVCTVIEEEREYYKLAEHAVGVDGVMEYFHKKWFIPVSNIDETEMVREKPEAARF